MLRGGSLLAVAALAWPMAAGAQGAMQPVRTQTLSVAEFLTASQDGKADTIAGDLRIPRPGNARLPAVVLMHGVSGVGAVVYDWADQLNALGVATLTLDSFTGRGIRPGAGAPLAPIARIVDAYRALEVLAAHPRIDPDRIAIMGFSHGATAALYSSLTRFARTYGPADGRRFAAHIAFYPACIQAYLEDESTSGRPIRVFHGTADDWLPIAACRDYVARLRRSGSDAQITEYEGAMHSFDNRMVARPARVPGGTSLARCRIEEIAGGRFVHAGTGQPFLGGRDACITPGVTAGYSAQAHGEAIRAVADFVRATLKP